MRTALKQASVAVEIKSPIMAPLGGAVVVVNRQSESAMGGAAPPKILAIFC